MQSVKAGSPKTFIEFPITPSGEPAVPTKPVGISIYDGKNVKVFEGDAFRGQATGSFEFTWTPPARSPVNPYRIVWAVQTAEAFLSHRSDFEIETVADSDFTFSTFLSEGFADLPFDAIEIGKAAVMIYDQHQQPALETWVTITQLGRQSAKLFPKTPFPAGEYTYIIRYASTGTQQVGNISAPPLRFWAILPRLRTYIDRAKAPYEQVKAYHNEHAYTWFQEALGLINSLQPITNFTFATFPRAPTDFGMEMHLVQAAAYFAIRSQLLLENELAFDYSGPNTNVTSDKTSGLESELGRLDALKEEIKATKKEIWRLGPVGSLAHRAQGARSMARRTNIRG